MDKERTGLVLGGGGARGAFEVGVWKALREEDIDIHIVTGTSVGSINGAMVAQNDFELTEKLWRSLETGMILDVHPEALKAKSQASDADKKEESKSLAEISFEERVEVLKDVFVHKGANTDGLKQMLEEFIDEKKVRESPIDYGLVTLRLPSAKEPWKIESCRLFVADIPEGKLHDFIMASSSFFPAMQAYEIDGATYIDGGYIDNVPVDMAIKRGAKKIIAVEINPENPFGKKYDKSFENMTWIKSPWELGNILDFNKENTARLLGLGYLEGRKALGLNWGHYFTFDKGKFKEEDVDFADGAAKVFELDPGRIYGKEDLNKELISRVEQLKREKFKLEKRSIELAPTMIVLSVAEGIKSLSNKRQESFLDYKGVVLTEEKNAIKYLVKEIL